MCIFCKWFKKLCGPNCECKCHMGKVGETDQAATPAAPAAPSDQPNQTSSNDQVK